MLPAFEMGTVLAGGVVGVGGATSATFSAMSFSIQTCWAGVKNGEILMTDARHSSDILMTDARDRSGLSAINKGSQLWRKLLHMSWVLPAHA